MRLRVATYWFVVGAVVLCVLLAVQPGRASATAGVNQELSFEGKIVTAAGLNIPDGTYNMEFKIYTAAGSCNPSTGAGCTLGWTEDWLVSNSQGVAFTSGTYQVNLDAVAANNFSGIDFNTYPLYLSLQIGSTSSCTPAGNFQANCGGDGEMKPYILLTASPYALNANALGGLSASSFGQLAANQTWTGANTFQPTTNITGLVIKQTSGASPSADIFNVQTANGSSVIQVTGPSANSAALNLSSVGANALTLTSGAALTFTGAANSTWDLGSGHTLSLQTTNNGPITTGTGLLTVAGSTAFGDNVSFSGTTARSISGPGTGGLTLTVASGPLSLTTTSSGALTITAAAASTWSTSAGALAIQSASGSAFTASAQGAGQTNLGTLGTGVTVVGNTTGSTELQGAVYTSSDSGVLIGNGTVTATPILLGLNNSSLQGAEAAGNCSTTINAGAIYYSTATSSSSTTTNEVRGCINGSWTDIVTADQLGVLLFGVVADSGPINPGDITGLSGYGNAPCKVTWASATSVTVAPCVAYSGGRKVVISSTVTISGLGTSGSIRYQHICLTGTNGAPQATASNTSETAALPAFSGSAPILCLATVKLNTTPAISNIYDTRVFTSSVKEFAGCTVAAAPGWIVIIDTTGDNLVTTTSTADSSVIRGIVAVGNASAASSNVSCIIIVSGPAFGESTGTINVGSPAHTSALAGYVATTTNTNRWGLYRDAGPVVANGNASACNASSNCQFSVLIDVTLY